MNPLVIDLESGPLPCEQLAKLMPEFEANKTLRDPEKIVADLSRKKADWIERAALSAETGRVLCVGFCAGESVKFVDDDDEKALLSDAAAKITMAYGQHTIVGHNLFGFDIPFLMRRMWINGIKPPSCMFDMANRRYNPFEPSGEAFAFDTMLGWSFGATDQRISLADLAKQLGVGEKSGSGKDFAALWASDRAKALLYLQNDLRLTLAVYERLRR